MSRKFILNVCRYFSNILSVIYQKGQKWLCTKHLLQLLKFRGPHLGYVDIIKDNDVSTSMIIKILMEPIDTKLKV